MKKSFRILILFLVLSLLFISCSRKEELSNKNVQNTEKNIVKDIKNKKDNKNKYYIFKDMEKLKKEYITLLENDEISKAIKLLDSNIKKLNKEEATEAVETLLYFLDVNLLEGNKNYFDLVVFGSKYRVKEENIDSFFKNIDDVNIRKLYEDLIDNNYMIKLDKDEEYIDELQLSVITINNKKILNKYEKYIRKDLIDLLKLKEQENMNLYSLVDGMVSLDKTFSNILKMEEYLEKYQESPYAQEVLNNLAYQYQAYFGYFDWSNIFDENDKIIEKAKKHFEKTIKEYPNTKVCEKTKTYLKTLESENYKKTKDVENLILDISEMENKKNN